MEDIIEQTITDEEITRMCLAYEQLKISGVTLEAEMTARFQYAHALLRSAHSEDIKHGINLLENLYYAGEPTAKRDYLYYIAIGQTRLKKYDLAMDCIQRFLQFEPQNHQALQLQKCIKEKLTKDGVVGMAITGGAALLIAGLIGLGMSMTKK